MRKDIVIGVLLVLIGIFIYVVFFDKPGIELDPEIVRLKQENKILRSKLLNQKLVTDSLLSIKNELETKWESMDKNIRKTVKYKYDEKINNIHTLDDDSTVSLLSNWLSKVDTVQRR